MNTKNLFFIILLCFQIFTTSAKTDSNQTEEQILTQLCLASSYDEDSVNAVLEQPLTREIKQLPADVSFLIADLKVNKDNIKLLEMGQGTRSYFQGHEQIHGQGQIWKELWKYLKQLHLPIWCVGKKPQEPYAQKQISATLFKKIGGRFVSNLKHLEGDKRFKQLIPSAQEQHSLIKDHPGIIIFRHCSETGIDKDDFKYKYPGFLYLDEAAGPHVNNKFFTNLLFSDPELSQLRPRCRAYPTTYSPDLASKIIKDLKCDTFVIKPLNSANGWGIIIVAKEDLDKMLKLIFTDKSKIKESHDKTYSYWANDKNKLFLVEEYVASKPVMVNGKPYDGTMRVVFALTYDNKDCDDILENINIQFLGHYWKLPNKSINDNGTLTELHKSKINKKDDTSAQVSPTDLHAVKKVMVKLIPQVYLKMITTKPKNHMLFFRDFVPEDSY